VALLGELESEKSAIEMVSATGALCAPLLPVTLKPSELPDTPTSPLTVNVLL
jgi:hypothetical protein